MFRSLLKFIAKYALIVWLVLFAYQYIASRIVAWNVALPPALSQLASALGIANTVAAAGLDLAFKQASAFQKPAQQLLQSADDFTKLVEQTATSLPVDQAKRLTDQANNLKQQAQTLKDQADKQANDLAHQAGLPPPPKLPF
jgi:predicted trehalose synthase